MPTSSTSSGRGRSPSRPARPRTASSIQTIEEGDILGWAWLVPPYRWHFDGHATDLVRAIAFDGQCLRTKCEKDHELGYELLKLLRDRPRGST